MDIVNVTETEPNSEKFRIFKKKIQIVLPHIRTNYLHDIYIIKISSGFEKDFALPWKLLYY